MLLLGRNTDTTRIDVRSSQVGMLHTVASLTTAATVLWHAVMGCCAHHEHAAISAATTQGTWANEATTDKPRHCWSKHQQPWIASPADADHTGAPARVVKDAVPFDQSPFPPCNSDQCSFAASKVTTSGELDLAPVTIGCSSVGAALPSVGPKLSSPEGETDIRPSPMRRHLALRILLI